MQGDIKLQSFEAGEDNNVLLKRNFPMALATVIHIMGCGTGHSMPGPASNWSHTKIYSL